MVESVGWFLCGSVAEGHALLDAINIRGVHNRGFAEGASAFGAFTLKQMASAGAMAQHFAAGRDLEPFGRGLLCFDTFGTSHKILFLSKKSAQYRHRAVLKQAVI